MPVTINVVRKTPWVTEVNVEHEHEMVINEFPVGFKISSNPEEFNESDAIALTEMKNRNKAEKVKK